MVSSTAIYARISSDPAGTALGVGRQLKDCRAEAARRGWNVVDEYVDNDVSAYSGKRRPQYQRLLDDIADRRCDAVIVYALDRLHRQPAELEEFTKVCDRAGLTQLATVTGEINLGTGDGLLVARILGAVSADESAKKSQRLRRKFQELAEQGQPHGFGKRPFGFEADLVTLRPDEAAIVRDLAARALAGETLASLTKWLIANDIAPSTPSGHWHTSTVKGMLTSARISGQREHLGEIVATAVWPAIISPTQTQELRALLNDPARRLNRTARRYLLKGLLRCHACDSKLMSHPRKHIRRYVCKKGVDFRGCGQLVVTAEPVERLISEAVLHRLASPAMARAITGADADADHRAETLREEITADRKRMNELAVLLADKAMSTAEWKIVRDRIEGRIKQCERELGRLTNTTVLDGYIGNADKLRTEWSTLNLSRQAAIIAAVLDHAVIHRSRIQGGVFDRDRVQPIWRI